ncbi:hypothetical protein DYC52_18825 [Vibrio cholerae]|nr:hypothetical protein [Vibrio cholerae]EGR1113632.1 hypothetical protein [Vibrio cholerae]EGR2525926.1 hypothetical protein [Vibrio cholerae]EGR2527885.1 hypothetical protein [Vibrio cholerae]
MFIIIMLAALCCGLCLCIAQVNRLPYRDFAQSNVVSLVLDSEQPNQRGPPSTSGRVLEYPTCSMLHPVSVAVGVNRDGGIAPDGSLVPQRLKAFAPRTNVREQYRLRRLARFALPFQRMTRQYQPDLLAVCSVGTDQPVE